jgi:hypothetical protein
MDEEEKALKVLGNLDQQEKKTYAVFIKEVHVSTRIVDAYNEEEALELAGNASFEKSLEYSYTLDEPWEVEEV